MSVVDDKFAKLGVDHALGQEVRTRATQVPLRGDALPGRPVDFSQHHAAAVAAVERIATLVDRYRALVA